MQFINLEFLSILRLNEKRKKEMKTARQEKVQKVQHEEVFAAFYPCYKRTHVLSVIFSRTITLIVVKSIRSHAQIRKSFFNGVEKSAPLIIFNRK